MAEPAAAAESARVDPVHQFAVNNIVDFGDIGGFHFGFTNSALFMVATVALIATFMLLGLALYASTMILFEPFCTRWERLLDGA